MGLDDLAVRGHELEAGDRGSEVAAGVARAVRRRRHGPRGGDVGERCEVVQSYTLSAQRLYQLAVLSGRVEGDRASRAVEDQVRGHGQDRKSTRLNSSHANISYAVFCLKQKNYSHANISYAAFSF